MDERVDRGAPAARMSPRERDQADAVAREPRDRCQRERGGHRVVELARRAEPRRHQAPAIEQQHHALAALDLVLRHHQLAAPRGRLPIDRTKRVAVVPLAQRFELGARAAQFHAAQTRLDRAVAQVQLAVALDRGEIGIDADRILGREPPPAADQAERRFEPDVERAQRVGAARDRRDRARDRRATPRRDRDDHLVGVEPQRAHRRLDDAHPHGAARTILDRVRELRRNAEREVLGRLALDMQLRRARAEQRVGDRRQCERRGERERQRHERADARRQREQQRDRGEQPEKACGDPRGQPQRAESQAAHARRSPFDTRRFAALLRMTRWVPFTMTSLREAPGSPPARRAARRARRCPRSPLPAPR